jgi:MFS family permease
VLIHSTWPYFPLAGLFFVALVPGFVSVLLAAVVVRDVPHQPRTQTPPLVRPFPARFWRLLVAVLVFSLGNSSDAFLILRANELGLGFARVVLAFALYNVVYAATALPLGRLSDRVGRKPVIIVGWLWFAAVYLAFAAARRGGIMWPLFAAYGLYQALSEGVSKAMVSDIVPPEQRAGALGLFYSVSGAGQLAASVLAGWLWPVHAGEHRLIAAFLLGSICAVLAVPLIASVPLTDSADTMPPR